MSSAVVPVPALPEKKPSVDKDIEIHDVTGENKKALDFTTSFTVQWRNKETGVIKVGTFTARRPTLGMIGQMAVLKSKLNGGEKVDPQTDFYHQIMSDLQVILIDVPDWWTPADFFDASPLREVWDHVRSWIETFRVRGVG